MPDQKTLLWVWWIVILLGSGVYSVSTLVSIGGESAAPVVRVASEDDDLWAHTSEQSFLQGVESRWWVSSDGGSWAPGEPPASVLGADPAEGACVEDACYRLVDGVMIERQTAGSSSWFLEHERDLADPPPANGEHRSDWEEERSLAVSRKPGLEVVAVAAGYEGVLVRSADGGWEAVSVGRSSSYGIRWWVVAFAGAAALVVGVVGDLFIRLSRPERSVAR